ncbi:MAG: putative DNA binding domain-containing protein [Lachnospiraceae bacterium]|jgi:ATP-dependent DNA helicase RecG|nr:putative DNA binding domain-containing protein [Lachnospiraceae bacterium]
MTAEKLKLVLAGGETIAVEFKRCGNGISADTYETVCAFLNRFGGDIYLGIEDDGTVCGLPPKAVPDMVKNFIKMVSNPDVISPTAYLSPEIVECEGKQIIRIHIPPSSEVHSYKRVVYDRVDDADVKVTATGQIAQMYIRKQKIYTEKSVYPYVREDDLRLDLLPRVRQRAVNRFQDHEWKNISDTELLKSAGLFGEDKETGKHGYNLAAVMLLGKDEVIRSVSPTYRTDALLRKVNLDRYDDRVIVQTNLIESYDLLVQFAEKHLLDKFYLEEDARVSLRGAIIREMLVNTLIHREFTSSYIAKFVIEKDRMYTENANRSESGGAITPENLEPNPKNPIIAAFFRNIWLADELGSGVRKLYRYVPRYSGKAPELIDGDVFRIIVPLDDNYSFDAELGKEQGADSKGNFCTLNCTLSEKAIIEYIAENSEATQSMIATAIGKSLRSVKMDMSRLQEAGVIAREGSRRDGRWIIKQR